MSQTGKTTLTHHAMLVAWGQYARCIGLVEAIEAVPLHQKAINHQPQTKVLEFLVTILGGFEYLKDITYQPNPAFMTSSPTSTFAGAFGREGLLEYKSVKMSSSTRQKNS